MALIFIIISQMVGHPDSSLMHLYLAAQPSEFFIPFFFIQVPKGVPDIL